MSSVPASSTPEVSAGQIALIDWLAFTVFPPPPNDLQWVASALDSLFGICPSIWESTGRGWNGYSNKVNLGAFGLLAHGGVSQKGTVHVSLNSHGCTGVADWEVIRRWGEDYRASITRVDLAHDDLVGAVVTVAHALQWYRDGGFTNAGRPPQAELRDDLDSGKGKTLYIGNRANGKLLRVYEKGRQLGDPESLWTRAELELHNQSRVIPWDVLTRPGAYPAFQYFSTEQCRIRTTKAAVSISFGGMVEHLRTVGGKALNVMKEAYEGDSDAVLDRLIREGRPKRLEGYPEEFLRLVRESNEHP